ncbi:MAG: alpha-ketoacid dehydrogenase subunit beta [Actinobacteria bacterium]|nr:alpha-ketoacid dehydrogenase subunit beta [Actinomycetota bacterium]
MSPLSYSQAYRAGLAEEMEANPGIFVMGTDIFLRGGHFAQLLGLGERFGADRIRDVPISEAAMVAAGVGAAIQGMRPVVDLNFQEFAYGAMDELCNQAAKIHYMFDIPVPLVIRATNGIAYGGAQHNTAMESWFAEMPGLYVAVPATPADAKGLIKTALHLDDPVLFLMHKALTGARGETGGPDVRVPFGRASVVRPGDQVTLIGYGVTVRTCTEAAGQLAGDGISAEVIDLRTLYPLDVETVTDSLRKTGRAVMVDESAGYGGVSAEIAAALQEAAFDYLDAPILRVHAPHSPVPQSPPLLQAYLPDHGAVEQAVRTQLARP